MNVTPPVSMPQPSVKPFIPATPPTLRNVEQYQPPTLGSHLYPVYNQIIIYHIIYHFFQFFAKDLHVFN